MYYGERLNSITHLTGTVLAAIGTAVLVVLAARTGNAWKIVDCSTYGACLLLLYGASTLYHSVRGRASDIVPPAQIIVDGCIHRCDAVGKNGRGDAAYPPHLDGIPAGGLENLRDGKGWESWRFDLGRALTPPELDALRKRAEIAGSRREAARPGIAHA